MSPVLVRRARPEDWPAVRGLLVQLGRPEPADDRDERGFRRVFLDYLDRDNAVAFVAESEGRLVGFCNLEYRTRLNFTSPQGWIPDLVVDEERRGRRVGAALIARAEELARASVAVGACRSSRPRGASTRTASTSGTAGPAAADRSRGCSPIGSGRLPRRTPDPRMAGMAGRNGECLGLSPRDPHLRETT